MASAVPAATIRAASLVLSMGEAHHRALTSGRRLADAARQPGAPADPTPTSIRISPPSTHRQTEAIILPNAIGAGLPRPSPATAHPPKRTAAPTTRGIPPPATAQPGRPGSPATRESGRLET